MNAKSPASKVQSIIPPKEGRGFTHKLYPELFFGLVGPVGVDLNEICHQLGRHLKEVGYQVKEVKLSELLKEARIAKLHGVALADKPENKRIDTLMRAGNSLRERMKRKDALSLFAVNKILNIRQGLTGDQQKASEKTAYIIRSFKTKEEIETLKAIYGPIFFVISVYSQKETRKNNLAKRIAESHGKSSGWQKYLPESAQLIDRDYSEDGEDFGQAVNEAFPLADLFVEVDSTKEKLKESVKRFIHSVFGYLFYTPTKNEFGMFLAFSAALRSADLSRQVGAAILTQEGDLLTIGCNEVPKFNGGQYWEDDACKKVRDFELGYDSSAYMKKNIFEETISHFQEIGLIEDKRTPDKIVEEMLFDKKYKFRNKISDIYISNLLEYGRMIHAEMAAITDAAKRGISLRGATLYCTTFPCHMCARHIISSGITRVVYVEPYPKSKAPELYEDSIVVDPSDEVGGKVMFLPFVGIAPYRFHDFFKHGKRKEATGKKKDWSTTTALPRVKIYNTNYINNEIDCAYLTKKILKDSESPPPSAKKRV